MAHAKVGDYIRIRDLNSANWVKIGNAYKVLEVRGTDVECERCFFLEGIETSWYAEEGHYTIIPAPGYMHPKYDTFEKGDTVRRWRDVEAEEWDCIGEVELPPLGGHVEVQDVDLYNDIKEDSFYAAPYGWMPMKAFILAEYYNQTITNRGTAELNDHNHGKSKISTGISIEVQRPLASISTGKRTSRGGVQGRGNATVTRGRHSSHQAITGR